MNTGGPLSILDLFAGPGGWDVALKRLGLDPLGVEWDDAACETRKAAGLRTLQGDVGQMDPAGFGRVDLLIASPPCQAWSMAGKRLGEKDKEHVIACAHELALGNDTRLKHVEQCEDNRSMLVVEPIRFIRHLRPTFVALEQVPPVLDLWTLFATFLERWGYSVWAGVLEAERYGVPQTRERAILIASRRGPVAPPEPTHQRYIPGEPQRHDITFDGEVLPWVSMAEALGWQGDSFVKRERSGDRAEEGFDAAAMPCQSMTSKVRSWDRVYDRRWRSWGGEGPQPDSRPATTVAGDPRLSSPNHHNHGEQNGNAIRVTEQEAAILQSFPPGHPFQGSRTKRFEQIGNAVPPLLAEAILRALLDMPAQEERKAA